MAIMLILGLSGAAALLRPVPVDFKLEAMLPPPAVAEQSVAQDGQPGASVQHGALRPRPILTTGFGTDVPLEFVTRQVVPASLHVEYGESVDRQLRVSWQGGKPWWQVLHAALAPLGLHAAMSGHTVRITQ